jgi:lipoic acid synthetase
VLETLDDLRSAGADIVNIGQYLQPTKTNIPVQKYWTPQEFAELRDAALEKGFLHCESGPMVRSSYHAGEQYDSFKENFLRIKALRAAAAGTSVRDAGGVTG